MNRCGFELEWRGCYQNDAKYAKYVTGESFAHPAKMSWGLLKRIFQHLQELNLLVSGTTVMDFMAGSGRTLTMSELFGYRSIGIELEPHFIRLIEGNKAQMERVTGRKAKMEFMQGDARQLSTILKERGCVGVVSPPYQDTAMPMGSLGYSAAEGNIGNLPDRQLVGITSPPYDNRFSDKDKRENRQPSFYGESENQIGNQNGSTYLEAMLQVYTEAFRSGISPLVIVVKNPTRNGKLRRLDLDTIAILQQTGYEIFDYHRAILFREVTQGTLGGECFKVPKGRMSFFKRLSYAKGNVVAQWEDVLFVRIPDQQGTLTGIVSPPYSETQTGGGIAIEGYRGKHINEMGKNQPDKVGDRCGYMRKCHGNSWQNIGNLPDK